MTLCDNRYKMRMLAKPYLDCLLPLPKNAHISVPISMPAFSSITKLIFLRFRFTVSIVDHPPFLSSSFFTFLLSYPYLTFLFEQSFPWTFVFFAKGDDCLRGVVFHLAFFYDHISIQLILECIIACI